MLNGELIKALVSNLGISNEEFAVRIKASLATVHNMYNGNQVKVETLRRAAETLGKTMEELMAQSSSPNHPTKIAG